MTTGNTPKCRVCNDTQKMHVVQPTMMVDEWIECSYCRPPVFVHISAANCQCGPEIAYVAPDGTVVYVHKELQ